MVWLDDVQEGVHGGRTGLRPLCEAIAAGASVVGGHVERLRRAALDELRLDSPAGQGSALEELLREPSDLRLFNEK